MRWSLNLLFLIVLFGAFFAFLFTAALPSMQSFFYSQDKTSSFLGDAKVIYQKTSEPKTYIGVIRTTGLKDDVKSELNLPYSMYQITDISQSSEKYNIKDSNTVGYVLAFENEKSQLHMMPYVGKCVKLEAYEMLVFADAKKQMIGGRSVLIPKSASETSFQSCAPYPEMISLTNSQKKKKFTVQGVIENQVRPAIDITYDYKIKFVPPFQGVYNPNSETGSFSEMSLIPGNSAAWKQMEENIGKKVQLTAYLRWGDDEVRYLLVESLR
ncbi:MAG: hypothetical protein U0525_03530 [Patescibacteria group bacterium]